MTVRSTDVQGEALQAAAVRELLTHADRLLAGLPWISDDVAEAYTLLRGAA